MIGRGSRVLDNKTDFTVIDLGNNARRFGLWECDIDWHDIFKNPDAYVQTIISDEQMEREMVYEMPDEVRALFKNSPVIEFDMRLEYTRMMRMGARSKDVLDRSIRQHADMVLQNSSDFRGASELVKILEPDIKSRVKHYSYCISKSTENYLQWMRDEYTRKLLHLLRSELA
jgi:hypothetical protein